MGRAAWASILLAMVGSAGALTAGHIKVETQMGCKTMCQRFGMKFIAKSFAEKHEAEMSAAFKKIKGPTECCAQCEVAFPAVSLAQVHAKPKAKSCVGAE